MCGRFTLRTPPDGWVETLWFDGRPNLPARYNIAPTQEAPVVRQHHDTRERELAFLRWGLIPSWSDDPDSG